MNFFNNKNKDMDRLIELTLIISKIQNRKDFDSNGLKMDLGGDIDNIINGYLTDINEYEKDILLKEYYGLGEKIKMDRKLRDEQLTIGDIGLHIKDIGVSFFKSVFGLHTY